jgi:proteasome lid subunit RPN8/RPN11
MQSILLSVEAFASILVECHRGMGRWETGGIIIGPKRHPNVITDIIPSTSFAERRPSTYYQSEKDVWLLNQRLRQYQIDGCDFKGYFHKHPSGMKQLSSGDLRTCSNILQSPSYKINNHLIMFIVTQTSSLACPLFSYFVALGQNKEVLVKETRINILPKTCIEICSECFEPLDEGVSHESNSPGQDSRTTERKRSNTPLRSQRKQDSDNKFPKQEERPDKDGCISKKETTPNQNLKRRNADVSP